MASAIKTWGCSHGSNLLGVIKPSNKTSVKLRYFSYNSYPDIDLRHEPDPETDRVPSDNWVYLELMLSHTVHLVLHIGLHELQVEY